LKEKGVDEVMKKNTKSSLLLVMFAIATFMGYMMYDQGNTKELSSNSLWS
jgi:hypothetical protein